jgi:nucleotide-binding universal stress UspA family protein
MFKHLLVPLDGSRLAEASLPMAAYLAEALGAWVTLTHVIERDAPQEIHGERHLSDPDQARAYLDNVAVQAFPAGLRVERHVHTAAVENVARSIVEHVGELGPDLIVMCTHGQGGLRTRLFGSIAQQVIALGRTPVLLIQPTPARVPALPRTGPSMPESGCRRLLVPLDGDPDHEQGLSVAVGLARACKADLYLVMVIPTLGTVSGEQAASARFLPGVTSALLDLTHDEAEGYLRAQVRTVQALGVSAIAEASRGDPAKVIVHTARKVHADLIVLGTHGKSGMEAFWSGSVAPEVTSRSHLPLLLVPVGEPAADSQAMA